MRCYFKIPTPCGEFVLTSDGTAVCAADFVDGKNAPPLVGLEQKDSILEHAVRELELYFAGKLREFTVPIHTAGTPFQQRVWAGIAGIPYGRLVRYGELAASLKSGPRAVGGATGRTPVSIFIP